MNGILGILRPTRTGQFFETKLCLKFALIWTDLTIPQLTSKIERHHPILRPKLPMYVSHHLREHFFLFGDLIDLTLTYTYYKAYTYVAPSSFPGRHFGEV